MSERIVSAGVFTKEIDQSLLPAAVGQIGAAIVGPTLKGPAFVPTKVSSFAEFNEIFGGYTDESYVPFAADEYLKNGDNLTVTRIMHEVGHNSRFGAIALGALSEATSSQFRENQLTMVSHVLLPTQCVNYVNNGFVFEKTIVEPGATGSGNFVLKISGSYSINQTIPGLSSDFYQSGTPLSASLNPTAANYITKILGTSPYGTKYPVYVAYENPNVITTQNSIENAFTATLDALGLFSDDVIINTSGGNPYNAGGPGGGFIFYDSLYADSLTIPFGSNALFNSTGSFAVGADISYTYNTQELDLESEFSFLYLTGSGVWTGTVLSSSYNPSNQSTTVFPDYTSNPRPLLIPYTGGPSPASLYFFTNASQSIYLDSSVRYSYTVTNGHMPTFNFPSTYTNATTPWITSQYVLGTTSLDLFRFHTISHGNNANHEVKVGIRDIKLASEVSDPDGYATFTVEVRRVNDSLLTNPAYKSGDTDRTPDLIESFRNCNLNPASDNYIGKKIGDRYQTLSRDGIIQFNGDYVNKSKHVRIEIADIVTNKSIDKTLIPFGFRALYNPIPLAIHHVSTGSFENFTASINLAYASESLRAGLDQVRYATTQLSSLVYHKNNYFGFDYSNRNNINYLAPVPSVSASTGNTETYAIMDNQNVDFYLGNCVQSNQAGYPTSVAPYVGSLQSALASGLFASRVALSTRKFMVPFQGGWSGVRASVPKFSGNNIKNNNTFGFDCTSATSHGTLQYKKAFNLLSLTDYYDINMLITPGLFDTVHPVATSNARNLITDRQDAFYVMDTHLAKTGTTATTVEEVVAETVDLDNNYVATYWPWVRINNPTNNLPIWVPPSVVVPGALAFNDTVAAPWYAPAGLNRGGLPSVTQTYQVLSQADRNALYEARINPIANFPNDGIVVWGQKTLQARPSALDRVNVRRLLIAVKKFIASATKYLVFDPNSEITRTKFLNIVNPYLEQVRAKQGLTAFRVVMDGTNNTADLIDQNILYGQIFLQPTRTAEFIILDFNIQPTGAAFPE